MPSALEIVLVVLVVALFFGAGHLRGPMRDAGRWAGRASRWTAASPPPAGEERTPAAALPRPPAVG